MACLSSRFPYGTPVTAEGLRQIDSAERYLHEVCGFAQVRARHHETLSRIELPAEDLAHLLGDPDTRRSLVEHFREIGYLQTTADLCGFRSGSMNEALLTIADSGADEPLFARVNPLLAAHSLLPAAYEQRDQMLVLRLPAAAIARLATVPLRSALAAALADLGLRYIALELDPLEA
jgi:hypothetical protein